MKPNATFKKKKKRVEVEEMINGLNEYVEKESWKGYKLNHFSTWKMQIVPHIVGYATLMQEYLQIFSQILSKSHKMPTHTVSQ